MDLALVQVNDEFPTVLSYRSDFQEWRCIAAFDKGYWIRGYVVVPFCEAGEVAHGLFSLIHPTISDRTHRVPPIDITNSCCSGVRRKTMDRVKVTGLFFGSRFVGLIPELYDIGRHSAHSSKKVKKIHRYPLHILGIRVLYRCPEERGKKEKSKMESRLNALEMARHECQMKLRRCRATASYVKWCRAIGSLDRSIAEAKAAMEIQPASIEKLTDGELLAELTQA